MFQAIKIATVLSVIGAAHFAVAGGSVIYRTDVAPLVSARPDLKSELVGLHIAESGDGQRISYIMCPALAGKRVGPYEFSAVDAGGNEVHVTFRTRERFVNAYGVVVAEFFDGEQTAGGDISNAIAVQEELVGISVLR
ncbi:MAG: hypothetical protein ACXVB9_11150 [Bdellovibrionota bacterium]